MPTLPLPLPLPWTSPLALSAIDIQTIWDFLSGDTRFSMHAIYMGCAIIGGAVLLLQLLMLIFGFGDFDGDVDLDGDIDGHDGLGFLSIRAIAGFLSFFGLTGMAGLSEGWHPLVTMGIATAAGLAMLFAIAWLMSMQKKLYSQGNLKPEDAVGRSAKVYLRIPAGRKGKGKITVGLQGREVQFEAVTAGDEIPTGGEVVIVAMTTTDTFEVKPLHEASA